MINQFLKIAGVKTQAQFYKKYPTEEAFFKAHPEARDLQTMAKGGSTGSAAQKQIMQIIQAYAQKSGSDPKQIMQQLQQMSPQQQQQTLQQMAQSLQGGGTSMGSQGMMAYGGMPLHAYGPGGPVDGSLPRQQDYPDFESYSQAYDNWLGSLQQSADNPTPQTTVQPHSDSDVTYPVYDADGKISSYVDANGYPVSTNPNMQAAAPVASTQTSPSFKLNDYQGGSVYDFLTAQGKAGDFKSRKKLAQALGMSNYSGSATQNAEMMNLIRQNPDILSSYSDSTAPQANVTRVAAQTKNKKAIPSTQELANSKSVAATGKPNVNWNSVPLMPAVTVVSKRKYKTMPGVTVYSKTLNPLQRAIKNNAAPGVIQRNPQTQQWEPVLVGNGPTAENAQRIKLAQQKNAEEAGNTLGLPQFRPGREMGGQQYEHGGYYGNVPQHGRPGTYSDGYSGTYSGGQYFAFGGLLGEIGTGMREGSLQALAGSILPVANMYQEKLTGSPITSEIKQLGPDGKPVKDNAGLKDELNKYLSSATGDIKKEDLQAIVSKFSTGGMAAQGYVPEYGSQAYGGAPLPQYGMGTSFQDGGSPLYSTQGQTLRNYMNTVAYTPGGWMPNHVQLPSVGFDSRMFPDGGEVSPEDQAAMDMQQAGQDQQPQQQQDAGQGGVDPQQIIQAVSQMLQQGMQPEEIAQKLVQMGVPQDEAMQIIQAVMQQMQGAQGQEAPAQEAMEGQAPPMGRWGGSYAYGGYNVTSQTTTPPYGVGNLSKFVGQTMAEPSLEAMHEAAMQRMQRQMELENVSRAGGYNDQVAQQYAQAASEAAALNANHRRQRQIELENMNRNQPYYNMDSNSGAIRKYPPRPISQSPRTWAEGGSIGEEMDVTPEQMEYLRKQGYKFDII